MTLRKHLIATAVALGTLGTVLPAAQAQSLSVSKAPGSPFVFTVSVTPATTTVNTLSFSFNGSVNFTSDSGPFMAPAFSTTTAANSSFAFFGPQTLGTETFTFTPTAGSTATLYNVAATGPTFSGSTSGSLAAPEPGSLVSMAVLGTCLGLGIVAARRRKMLAS